MGSSTTKISLKLLVDDKSKKVLFAEAGKDFIDFLFGLMEIPVGTIAGLIMEGDHRSPIVSVYKSVKNLDPTYLQTQHQDKNSLLKPKPASSSSNTVTPPLLANLLPQSRKQERTNPQAPSLFGPSGYTNPQAPSLFGPSGYTNSQASSPFGGYSISSPQNHPREVGYVKEMMTYMVMDDMEVKPMSSISSITLMDTFKVKDVRSLKEQNVVVDKKKALELLKALFKSNTDTVLTDVFLEKKKTTPRFSSPDIDI